MPRRQSKIAQSVFCSRPTSVVRHLQARLVNDRIDAMTSLSPSASVRRLQTGCGRSCAQDKRPLLSEAALEGPSSRWSPMLAVGLCPRVAVRTTAAPARRTGTASPLCARCSRKSNIVDIQPPWASGSVTPRKRCDDGPVKIGSCRSRRYPSMTASPETGRCAFA
jgi:hypothetical protein